MRLGAPPTPSLEGLRLAVGYPVVAMVPEQSAVADAYLEQLTPEDVALLLGDDLRGRPILEGPALLRQHPGGIGARLARPEAFEAVFLVQRGGDPLIGASPFLAFAVAVHRAAAELESASYVAEWLGPGRRAPVFDVSELRDFVSGPWRRLFLTELLASYTRVASGSVVVSTRRGWRRQRFSELDPVRFAGLLEVVSEVERPGVLRRLGDLSLFLTGVFPDHVARQGFGPVEESRLLRAGGMSDRQADAGRLRSGSGAFGDTAAVDLLEQLGRRWYRAAFDLLPRPVPRNLAAVGELSERFGQARRFLSLVTERYLFPHRGRWFGFSGG